jgi:transposase-like protein
MTLDEYITLQVATAINDLLTQAPVDTCPHCTLTNAHLTYNKNRFSYVCDTCGQTWEADALEIDDEGRFQLLEWAD